MISVLFVCLGNICRSPMAEGIFLNLLERHGLQEHISCDSAGTSGYHIGDRPDPRMRATAQRHGFELRSRARQLLAEDRALFDYIIAMDRDNLTDIRELWLADPQTERAELLLMRSFDPTPEDGNVPDPYYGGTEGFEYVYRILDRSNQKFLQHIREKHDI